jgi:vacuolar-type H+-ATPase subunit B/Vma2
MKTRETQKLAEDLADMKTRETQKIEDMKARETDKITRMQERFDAKMEAENERLAEAKARFQEFIREEKARADQRSERANRLIEIALNQGAQVLEQQPLSDFALITGEFLKLFKEREMKQ